MNIALQTALNPPGELKVERFGWTFCPGDKVMQVANDYERDVFNGDLGVITGLDPLEAELTVSFESREVVYGFGELDEFVLAYATTIHKIQGSEYPAVVTPLTTQHYTMLARNLLYTGVTRGKRLVVLLGQRRGPGHCGKERQRAPALVQVAGVARSGMQQFQRNAGSGQRCCAAASRRYNQPRSRNPVSETSGGAYHPPAR